MKISEQDISVPVLLLAGGRGSRLGSRSTPDTPKSLVRINDWPIIDYVLANLLRNGFKDIHLALGFGAQAIEAHIQPWREYLAITAQPDTGPGYGSAHIIRLVPEIHAQQTKLVIFADVITNDSLIQLVDTHNHNKSDMTMPVGGADYPQTDHVVVVEKDRIVSVERNHEQLQRYNTLRPYFVMEKDALNMEIHDQSDIVNDILPHLLSSGERIVACNSAELYLDCGTPERIERAQFLMEHKGWLTELATIIETVYNGSYDR